MSVNIVLIMERSVLASEPGNYHWASHLHSEYRSTYKWHEFKADAKSGVLSQPAPNPTPGLPPARGAAGMPTNQIEPTMHRRKKYPGVAYRANEFFVPTAADAIRPQTGFNRARSVQRDETTERAGRRSKSEGPRQTRWTDTIEPKATTALGETLAAKDPALGSSEYRNQFAWPKDTTDSAPRKSISMGALKKAAVAEGSGETEPLMERVDEDRISKSYNEDYLWNGQKKGVQRKSTFRSALSALISNGDRSKDNIKRYKSEYKKKFRPFSQYVFESSKGTFTKCRGKEKTGDREASERMLSDKVDGPVGEDTTATLQAAGLQPLGLPQGDSWFREVMDLRKQAGEYKYRGWGTELAPEHLTQLYNKQMDLWYQVSKRSSLSALSLAATNHRSIQPEEKEGKDSKTASPKKFRSFKSAPHQSIHMKLQESKAAERSPHKTSPQKQKKKIQGQSFDEGNAQVDGVKPEHKAEFRSPRRRPRSADPAPVAQKHLPNGHDAHPRPYKPTGLPLNKTNRVRSPSVRGARSPVKNGSVVCNGVSGPGRGPRSRSISKVGIKLDEDIPSHRSASVAKDQFLDDSPVIKSPPEPTRVKSPEQMNMRSPDPVNWTVPLDTGKTFTVTQNVKSEIAPTHHQQMSPIRMRKSESPTSSKRTDKTPTPNLTPIDETKPLDLAINGHNGMKSTDLTPEGPAVIKSPVETVVSDNVNGASTAVLENARNRFDKFWGKKDEDSV